MPYDALRNVKMALSIQAHEMQVMNRDLEKMKADNQDFESRLSQARIVEREKEKALQQERLNAQEL